MINYMVASSNRDLIKLREYLYSNAVGTIAIDFESENNLHEYGSRICLIQIFDGNKYFIIDPFNIGREQLKEFLEDKKVIKLGYGCDSDKSLLFKQYQIRIKSLYDLKIMVDVLDIQKKGLGEVNRLLLGIESNINKKKYQMHNWTIRPIEKQAIEYALSDVAYLFSLKKILLDKIIAQGLVDLLLEQIVQKEYDYEKIPIPTMLKSREFNDLRKDEQERVKIIFDIRERYAKEQNCPANDMLLNSEVICIARNLTNPISVKPRRMVDNTRFTKMISEIQSILRLTTT